MVSERIMGPRARRLSGAAGEAGEAGWDREDDVIRIGILTTAHGLLTQAERIQAEQVTASPAADHGAAGRMVAEYANTVGASTIVVGAATHRGLPALMDDSATHELSRLARSDIMIVSPDAPSRLIA